MYSGPVKGRGIRGEGIPTASVPAQSSAGYTPYAGSTYHPPRELYPPQHYQMNTDWAPYPNTSLPVSPCSMYRSQSIPHLSNPDYFLSPTYEYGMLPHNCAHHSPSNYPQPLQKHSSHQKLSVEDGSTKWKERYKHLEQYMKNLPSQDEFEAVNKSLEELKSENESLKYKNKSLEKTIGKLKVQDRNKEERMEALSLKVDELKNLEMFCAQSPNKDHRDCQAENERLLIEINKLQQDLLRNQKYLSSHLKFCKEQKDGKDKVETSEMLLAIAQEKILGLKSKLTHLENDKKDVEGEVLRLEGELNRRMDKMDERRTLEQQLLRELFAAVFQLGNIAEILGDHLEDKDLNISALLTIEEFSSRRKGVCDLSSLESMKEKLEELKELKLLLSNLRDTISQRYAEHLGQNLQCATQ